MTARSAIASAALTLVACGAPQNPSSSSSSSSSSASSPRVEVVYLSGRVGAASQVVIEGGRATSVRSEGKAIGVFGADVDAADHDALARAIEAAAKGYEPPGIRPETPASRFILHGPGAPLNLLFPAGEQPPELGRLADRVTKGLRPLRAFHLELTDVDGAHAGKPITATIEIVSDGSESMVLELVGGPFVRASRPVVSRIPGITPVPPMPVEVSPRSERAGPFEVGAGDRQEIDIAVTFPEAGAWDVWVEWYGSFVISGDGAPRVEDSGELRADSHSVEVLP